MEKLSFMDYIKLSFMFGGFGYVFLTSMYQYWFIGG